MNSKRNARGTAHVWRAYRFAIRLAFRQSLGKRSELAARIGLFACIMAVFSQLWRVTYQQTGQGSLSAVDASWYLAITEWIILSLPMLHLDIEQDVRTGDVACFLTRPVPYLGLTLARGLGDGLARLTVLAGFAFTLTWLMVGQGPSHPWQLLPLPLFGGLAIYLGLLSVSAIGLGAFWLQECTPLYWVWQKSAFIFGGLLLPLSVYPPWLEHLAAWTPFAAMLNRPAQGVFAPVSLDHMLGVLGGLVGWCAVVLYVAKTLYRRGLTVLDINGG